MVLVRRPCGLAFVHNDLVVLVVSTITFVQGLGKIGGGHRAEEEKVEHLAQVGVGVLLVVLLGPHFQFQKSTI